MKRYKHPWRKWFAWYPVKLELGESENKWVWLKWVRRYRQIEFGGYSRIHYDEFIPNENGN